MFNRLKGLTIIGIGPSDKKYIYSLALEEIKSADILAGSHKILDKFKHLKKDTIRYGLEFEPWIKIVEKAIKKNKVAVLVSGDPGFYSLASLIVNYFKPYIPKVLPGISSLQLAYSKIGRKWNNVEVVSLHGRDSDITEALRGGDELVLLADEKTSITNISNLLCRTGQGAREIYICSNLGSEEESIFKITAQDLDKKHLAPNSVLILEPYDESGTRFFGIGVGIGGSEMVTMRAARTLKIIDTLFVPISKNKSDSRALMSAKRYLRPEARIIEIKFQMIKDRAAILRYYREYVDNMANEMESGKKIGFITIGDPLLYSTYNYILKILKEKINPDLVETIPGINTFSHAFARLNQPLVEGNEKMAVLPCSNGLEGYVDIIKQFDTVILMKIGKNIHKVLNLIKNANRESESYFFKNIGLGDEVSGEPINRIGKFEDGYLSTIVIRRKN
ncbi:MAG: precorrin-2 C(20)-methyltransferase [Actinomycetia bacterium]|nr:precorrin-2 C(20)-methyltransferase [Actinomycetes bacterium]